MQLSECISVYKPRSDRSGILYSVMYVITLEDITSRLRKYSLFYQNNIIKVQNASRENTRMYIGFIKLY